MYHNVRDSKGRFTPRAAKKSAPVVKKAVPKKVKQNQRVILILDDSLSMRSLQTKVVEKYKQLLQDCQTNAHSYDINTLVDVYTFNRTTKRVSSGINIDEAVGRNIPYYASGPSTSLFDAVAEGIKDARENLDFSDKNTSYLMIVLTDGQDNSSRIGGSQLAAQIASVQSTDRWTLTFQVPKGGTYTLTQLGIPAGNIIEWEQTEEGLEQVSCTTSASVGAYYGQRSMGLTASPSFYVQPDLSNKTKEIKKLNNLSNKFTVLTVPKECDIKDFVTKETGHYTIGKAYYPLSKPEVVQPQKRIVLMDRFSKKIYGGNEAREILGLPPNAKAKVEPGNHASYDIFIQSTSVNRKLVRGSKLLVENS